MYNYHIFENNAGFLHLAVVDEHDACVYYLCDADRNLVMATLAALKAGGDPIADGWEGGESDPAACYAEIVGFVESRNGGATEIFDL